MLQASFLDFLKAGNLSFAPFASIDGRRVYPEKIEVINTRTLWLHCIYNEALEDDFYFTDGGEQGICCRRVFANKTGAPIRLNELGIELGGISFGGKASEDYFYHNENPRIYQRMTFPIDYNRTAADASDTEYDYTAGTRWADPGVVSERIGASPYQPFPAIHLGNYASTHGLVHGTLDQKVFYHNYLTSHKNDKVALDILSSFKAIAYLDMADSRVLVDEWWLGCTDCADQIEHIFDNYTAVLRKKLPANYGSSYINRDNLVWGSWNDGNHRNITEDGLLREAAYLAEKFPTVRWFQLDDGYAKDVPPAHGLGVPYEGEEGIHPDKFPNGLRHYTNEVRKTGLRPAIWIGGLCAYHTKIFREHPEWFCDYSIRLDRSAPLDVSKPEVREYICHALDVLLQQYGFEAVKHDFWSYAFEDSHDLLSNKTESGYYYRDWWLREMRRRLPGDGYLQTGCDIVMGNPFLGQYFTNYRYGIDIGAGHWDHVKTNFLWGAACFATHTGDLFVPNSDSIGIFPGLNDTDAMFALNYCLVTHSMVEIAGNLSRADADNPRLKVLHKAACNINNGQDVYFTGYDYRSASAPIPAVFYFKTPHFSTLENHPLLPQRTVGLFNTEDETLSLSFTAADLDMDGAYHLLNVWTQETYEADDGVFRFELGAHGSLLLALIPQDKTILEDANVKVTSAEADAGGISVGIAYAFREAELRFTKPVSKVLCNGAEIPFESVDGICKLAVPAAGEYTFLF
ncbi:MAG: hypothetical protein E7463_02260 [Ruminococcaceae bacterium]|nr:hypothetical protein [Oscillospiraceae bacterium]